MDLFQPNTLANAILWGVILTICSALLVPRILRLRTIKEIVTASMLAAVVTGGLNTLIIISMYGSSH